MGANETPGRGTGAEKLHRGMRWGLCDSGLYHLLGWVGVPQMALSV